MYNLSDYKIWPSRNHCATETNNMTLGRRGILVNHPTHSVPRSPCWLTLAQRSAIALSGGRHRSITPQYSTQCWWFGDSLWPLTYDVIMERREGGMTEVLQTHKSSAAKYPTSLFTQMGQSLRVSLFLSLSSDKEAMKEWEANLNIYCSAKDCENSFN